MTFDFVCEFAAFPYINFLNFAMISFNYLPVLRYSQMNFGIRNICRNNKNGFIFVKW